MTVRIGNAAGFLGDQLDAPRRLVERAALDFLTLEYLAELTLSILARQREKDHRQGYASDFLDVLPSLVEPLKKQPRLRIVTNAGGMNPAACVEAVAACLVAAGLPELTLACVGGDDLLPRLDALQQAGCPLAHLDTGAPLSSLAAPIVSANAYLGGREIAASLDAGARIVITGRVADASLTVGPAVHAFGWAWDDWTRLAAASVAGHVIECGLQATGGFSPFWRESDLALAGFPIAELDSAGGVTVTKPAGSGGIVDRRTVAEQLVYEIGDPAHYLTPDVDVDFRGLSLEETGPDRVAIHGARGAPAPEQYKVSLAYRAGFQASASLLVYGRDCVAKARECARIVFDRLAAAEWNFDEQQVECLGAGESVPGRHEPPSDLREVMLRMTVADRRREAVERFSRELIPLATGGPAGLAGYTAARGVVRPVYAYWPTLVPRSEVAGTWEVRTARAWSPT